MNFKVEIGFIEKIFRCFALVVMVVLVTPAFVFASTGIDKADTAWILISTALVMFMTPGLAFFYAGMTRKKNVLATMMHSFFILCLISIQWIVI